MHHGFMCTLYELFLLLLTDDEAAGFPAATLGAEHGVAAEVHRAVLRVVVVAGGGSFHPLRHGRWPRSIFELGR